MLNRKYSVNRVYLIIVWFILFLTKILLAGFLFTILIFYFNGAPFPFRLQHGDSIGLTIILFFILIIWIFWRKTTYSKQDFLKLSKSIGIKFIKSQIFPKWYGDISHTYLKGLLDDIFIAAIIDHPSNTFYFAIYGVGGTIGRYKDLEKQLFHSFRNDTLTLETTDKNTPLHPSGTFNNIELGKLFSPKYLMEYLDEESRIELFSLINGPFNIDVKIKIEGDERDVPTTDCPEIDRILRTSLSDVKHFYARLIFNKDCLRMTIIGGSWEGERFRQKIIKGFEIFQAINNELKKKYL